jgi:RHS repeat-associated protein
LPDHLNTIRDIVKSDGKVAAHLEYNSFGKQISVTKNDNLSFAYTGKLFDQTSDLQWNINRWYDSNVGRWVSEYPTSFKGRDGNLYRYALNRQIMLFDYNGKLAHAALEIAGKALTIYTITDLVRQGFGTGGATSYFEGTEYPVSVLIRKISLDQYIKQNRDSAKKKNKCISRHIVMWELSMYDTDRLSSSLRDTYALNKEEYEYQFNDKDVRDEPVEIAALYKIKLKCSNTYTSTCISIRLDKPGEIYTELCDFGFSIGVYYFAKAWLFSYYGDNYNEYEKIQVDSMSSTLFSTYSCESK